MNSDLDYQQINPKSEQLKSLIKLYYIHRSADESSSERIVYFPNYVTTINIYQHSKVSWTDYSRTHEYDERQRFLKLFVSKFDRSREIITKGRFDKLSIVFHPLGINHFLPKPLSHYTANHFSFFDHFGASFEEVHFLITKNAQVFGEETGHYNIWKRVIDAFREGTMDLKSEGRKNDIL